MDNEHINLSIYSKLDYEQKNYIHTLLFRREDLIRSMYFESVERSIKTLFLLNAGGIITILANIVRNGSTCSKIMFITSLIIFLLGLHLSLLTVLLDFRSRKRMFFNFISKAKDYLADKIPYKDINEDKNISPHIIVYIGYAAAICIPIGIFFGLFGYLLKI